jgi:transposase
MPPVNRNAPKRAGSSDSKWSFMEFVREFPDDAACLEWLWRERVAEDGHTTHCPKCDRTRRFHRVNDRPAYDCDSCGYHLHPLKGTIFEKSSTSLHLWFYAMYLASSTRTGISAKQIERELGVTYKTAWRMLNLIRNQLMDQDDDDPLSGEVEIDETAFGGKPRAAEIRRHRTARRPQQAGRDWARDKKVTVFGMVERGGRVRATVVPSRDGPTLGGVIEEHVLTEATIFTDEFHSYRKVGKRYAGHRRIRHKANIYVDGNVHTNTIEGFFSNLKRGIGGTYHAVSHKWLQGYLNEYVWRYNRRDDTASMFETLLLRAAH